MSKTEAIRRETDILEAQFDSLYVSDEEEDTTYSMDTMTLTIRDGDTHDTIHVNGIGVRFHTFYQNTVVDTEYLYFKRDGNVSASVPLEHLSDEAVRLLHGFYDF
jgi:hypothetical protein